MSNFKAQMPNQAQNPKNNKQIIGKKAIPSILGWSVLGYTILFILSTLLVFTTSLLHTLDLKLATIGLVLLFSTILSPASLLVVYYVALSKNWRSLQLLRYKSKLTYILCISTLIMVFNVLVNFLLTKQLELPKFGLIELIIVFLVPAVVKTDSA